MIVERLLKVALLGSAWVLWLLLALSVASFAAMIERWAFFRRHRDDHDALRAHLATALRDGDLTVADDLLARSPSIEARVVRAGLAWRDGGPEAVSDAVESELSRERDALERGSNLLGTLGSNTPFVGLFGTVIGVVEAFHHLADANAQGAGMGAVMAGIAEALVATAVGIFVAIPAVVAYNVVQKRVADIEGRAAGLTRLVTAALRARSERPSLVTAKAA